jgi:peptidoglycan/LPS O-acetylase OafA/YrhL
MAFHYELRQEREPWKHARTWMLFWSRRFFRIAPLYYVVLVIALLAGPYVGHARETLAGIVPGTASEPSRYFDQSPMNILAHLTFVFGQIPYYSFRTPLPDWSIGLEMAFYAVFPFIMLASRRLSLVITAVVLAVLAFALLRFAPEVPGAFRFPSFLPLRLHLFMAGSLIAAACTRSDRTTFGMVAVALALSASPIDGNLLELSMRLLLAAGLSFMVHGHRVASIRSFSAMADNFLGLKPFRILGDLSYGAYLIHLLVLIPAMAFVAQRGFNAPVRFALATTFTIAVVYLAAWLAHRFIEQPGIALGKRLTNAMPKDAELLAGAN